MPTLDPSLRDQLATVIGKENADTGARLVAEAGAKAAIEALAVHLPSPYAHLDAAQKQLRNRLRARARQLGDTRHGDGRHEIGRLVEQAAYEHWHRMLFARFLAENDLLIHPDLKVAVTLEECAELAASEGAADGWELAGRYASRMLPQIFRPDDPLLAVRFAIDDVKKLEALLDSLPADLFRASDSLGWCYQFWQARKKKEVNASEVKIGADELPAVTQLFTEPYMVQFLLHNTLGAWWAGAGRALPVEMPYLRLLDDGTPAAGTFEGWPRLARELKVLDPCCGSGHFLVAAFEILVAFRVAEEGLTAREACDAVLRDNLFGLEIDARCVQIAAFALAMAAWTYPDAGGYRPLAPMNVACSGLAISAKKEEWERLGGDNARLRAGMVRMWELFSDAPVLGSLIDPSHRPEDPLLCASHDEILPNLQAAVASERSSSPELVEAQVTASGVAQSMYLMAMTFDLVITNVPYLSRGKQCNTLQQYASTFLPDSAQNLATMMMERMITFASSGGSAAAVVTNQWFTAPRYRSLRSKWLRQLSINLAADLGSNAFRTPLHSGVRVALVAATRSAPLSGNTIKGLEGVGRSPELADDTLRNGDIVETEQSEQRHNVDSRIVLTGSARAADLLAAYAESIEGLTTGDMPRFVTKFWELPEHELVWKPFIQNVNETTFFGGRSDRVRWERGGGSLHGNPSAHNFPADVMNGWPILGQMGVRVSQMEPFACTLYSGEVFGKNAATVVPHNKEDLPAIWCFLTSSEFGNEVRKIDSSLKVTNATLVKVPFDRDRWNRVASQRFPHGLPSSNSNDQTQWVFSGRPRSADSPLHVAVARLLGFRWPDQQPDVLDAHADKDGIVCLPALRGERPAADRLADLLAAAWGKDWHPQTLTDLLAAVGHQGTLEEWLRDAFFKQHCELFHHRPFVWHVWDGHREGFSALVNYHMLDHEGLKSLTYSYLGDWIRTQEIEAKAGKSGAGDKLAKAKALQQRLAAILEGEAPLDVFVRWKPIEQQPIGWHPDLDDGVRLNIRPFLTVADVGAKGAGVLRWKPNVKWGKDRGKNPQGSPWGEERHNDKHLTLAEKRAARGEA